MKIQSITIFIVKIPFKKNFNHGAKIRKKSESLIVKLTTDTGIVGYGEGAPRFYVTGEKTHNSAMYIEKFLWPKISKIEYLDLKFDINPIKALIQIERSLPNKKTGGIIAWNSAITAIELAIIDCLLKTQRKSLSDLLKPKRHIVKYSGVIGLGSVKESEIMARKYKSLNINQIKIKIGRNDDYKRIKKIRNILGDSASIRLDANGIYTIKEALKILPIFEKYKISCVEQPIKRSAWRNLKKIKDNISTPIMADESLVTIADARNLIKYKACDYLNLRISKLGGISKTLKIAQMAKSSGFKLQLGCLVGETAILSSVGRFLAAYLNGPDFVEGSFGTLLLSEDISKENINFGFGGNAQLLKGYGFGIKINDKILFKYSTRVMELNKN